MRILIIHEIDWLKKVVFEPHHLAELFSIMGHQVFVIDCQESNFRNLSKGFNTQTLSNFNRVYENASITLIRPKSILIKGLNRISHFLSCRKIIKKTIIDNKIDLVFLYGVATNGVQTIEIVKELDIPVVFRVLDVAHELVTNKFLRNRAKKYEKIVLQNSDMILATTPHLAEYSIEMGAQREKVESFPLGINANIFFPVEKNENLQNRLGINKDDFVIIFIGTIFEFSGLDYIISKFDELITKTSKIKLLIVGGGPALSRLKSMVKKKKLSSNVIFTGFKPQDDLPNYISLANVCLNPFRINAVTNRIIPTKILEYFACGKPVLSTPLEGTVKLLPNEEFGILYSPLENFVEKLSILTNDRESLERLGKLGYEYVQENHNWENLSKKLIKKFETLTERKIKTGNK